MRAVAVDHVEPDEERDAEPRLLDGEALHLVNVGSAPTMLSRLPMVPLT